MRTFTHCINLGPALAANHTFNFTVPEDCSLAHVSACNSSANKGTLKIGSTSDDDLYLTATDFGVSGTPAEVGWSGFVGGQSPHLLKGTVVSILVTDHASHMANVYVVLTFQKG
jgi:hypothetical protein